MNFGYSYISCDGFVHSATKLSCYEYKYNTPISRLIINLASVINVATTNTYTNNLCVCR